ncbi:MAG: cyclic nucleotide-binding domain-containing protein [Elainellaceae cyanobacterium]
MTEVLLRELSNADLDWMLDIGQHHHLPAETVICQPQQQPDDVYLLLDGAIALTPPPHLGTAEADEPLVTLANGEFVGETALLNLPPLTVQTKVLQDSAVLRLPYPALKDKLQQDRAFAAHFNRAIALLLSERLRRMYERPDRLRFTQGRSAKEAMFVLGEMRDSDIDWLTTKGEIQRFAPGDFLVKAGRSVEALYVILDGGFSVLAAEGARNPLTLCFACPIETASTMDAITTLGKGEMAGMVAFLDFRPMPVTIRAAEESLVLSVPRQTLAIKLLQDLSFAARFYRVVAIQVSNIIQTVLEQLGYARQTYDQGMDLDETEFEGELDLDSLQQMSQGAARFNWMLKQLGVAV